MEYVIRRLPGGKKPVDWKDPLWSSANELRIDFFHPKSSAHHPQTRVWLLYDDSALFIVYQVADQYVRCVQSGWQAAVCRDSCVEAFLHPKPQMKEPHAGYLNFETNCGGSMLLYYIENARRTPAGFEKFTKVPAEAGRRIEIRPSLPARVQPEIPGPIDWQLQLMIPFSIFESYVGPLGKLAGQTWRANFLKCADDCSHPHWGSWSSIGEQLNFHQPDRFGSIRFGE